MNHFAGVATAYEGISFRSKLEASWAAFFDLVGWAWEYEPDGFSKYIPDFVLHGTEGRRVYVEVKPSSVWEVAKPEIIAKARRAIGHDADLLILGDFFPECSDGSGCLVFGLMPGDDTGCEQARLFRPGIKYGTEYDFAHTWGGWQGRLSGAYDGNTLIDGTLVEKAAFLKLWSQARNRFQWMPAQ